MVFGFRAWDRVLGLEVKESGFGVSRGIMFGVCTPGRKVLVARKK